MLASDPASCPCCQHETERRPSGGSSSDSGQEGSGSGDSGGGEEEAGADVARTSEDGASLELGKEDEEGPADGAARLCEDVWRETRAKLRGIVDSKYFNRGIMMAILVNTVSMGIEHHQQASGERGVGHGVGWHVCARGLAHTCSVSVSPVLGPIQPHDLSAQPRVRHGEGRAQGRRATEWSPGVRTRGSTSCPSQRGHQVTHSPSPASPR